MSSEIYSTSVLTQLSAQSAAFRFVALLAGEVSKGQVDLPAFPEVVARVKAALANEDVSPAVVAKLVMAESGLAARMMTLANSAIMNRSGVPITELKSAVTRIGYNNVRASAVAYAIAKLHQAKDLQPIKAELEMFWKEATRVAALCHAIARRVPGLNADEALLTGLVHNLGKVYILSRSQQLQDRRFNSEDIATLIRDWHANVGKAIVETWKFAPHLAAAIGDYEDLERVPRAADLADVLYVATQLGEWLEVDQYERALPKEACESRAAQRLSLDEVVLQQIIRDAAGALKDLRRALGA